MINRSLNHVVSVFGGKSKALAREILPPILQRQIRRLPATGLWKASSASVRERQIEGKERDPEWYDWSFLNSEHWREHYSNSRYYPLWAVIADRVTREQVRYVFDIGCGSGQLASLLRDKQISSYIGVDFSPKRIEWARKVCPEFDFLVADVFETDLFHSYDYDAVIATEFLEHIEYDLDVLRKISRGARFYGTVPKFPYTSHVRHFENEQQVYDRYRDFFEEFKVDTFASSTENRAYYMIEGVKR